MNDLSQRIKDLKLKVTGLEKEKDLLTDDLNKSNKKCSNSLQEIGTLKTRLDEEI